MAVKMVATLKRFIGLSTDAKPIDTTDERIWDGSSFFEEDTGKFFLYDQAEGWIEKDPNLVVRGGNLVSSVIDLISSENAALMLKEMKAMNAHLASISGEKISSDDFEV